MTAASRADAAAPDSAAADLDGPGDPRMWISLREPRVVDDEVRAAAGSLAGTRLAVKDNIDVAGLETTAGCRAFAYRPRVSAPVVSRMTAAGAVVVGKATMDMFATGLTGTRGPDGPLECAIAPGVIAGGSSSGSALAVASGRADIGLGTDTAGSGRVPAALNGIVGVKPTRGLVSTDGVVPACRSLDCVSLFARTVREAAVALGVCVEIDGRTAPLDGRGVARDLGPACVGVPDPDALGCDEARALFAGAVERCVAAGMEVVSIDVAPLLEAGLLLYHGPWVAERAIAVGDFVAANPGEVDPVVREVILAAGQMDAQAVFDGMYRLDDLTGRAAAIWSQVGSVLLPTTDVAPTILQVAEDPHGWQARLGRFTNFVNLMDLCAVSVPAGRWRSGAGFGVQFVAPGFRDGPLIQIAERFECSAAPVRVSVVGAHLRGQPLNRQLTDLGARFVTQTRTAPTYELFALADTVPPKPGLVRTSDGGMAIEVEVWEMTPAGFGAFVAAIPQPLGIGAVDLIDGSSVRGFICEPAGLDGATRITDFGGWRAYLASLATP